MKNPVRAIREELGLTKSEMARWGNISAPTYEYIEQGAYGKLPKRLKQTLRVYRPNIEQAYDEWKMNKRINWKGPLQLSYNFPLLSEVMHPHEEWRSIICAMSITHYAEALCISRSSIQQLESNRIKSFPQELRLALIMACGSSIAEKIVEASRSYNE